MTTQSKRRVIPVDERFFNDGHWYVLASSSLGGSGLSAETIAQRLQSNDSKEMHDLLNQGICLPMVFPGDCALDNVVFVLGELDEREQREWIGRVRSKLVIPCGEFMLMGGGLDEDFEVALPNRNAPDPHYVFFDKLNVEPGTYLVEVYAFLSSMSVNLAWETRTDTDTILEAWRRRPKQAQPAWLQAWHDEGYVDSEDFGLLEYIICLTPLIEDVLPPALDEDRHWVSEFEMRWPDPCPRGLPRNDYQSA